MIIYGVSVESGVMSHVHVRHNSLVSTLVWLFISMNLP